MNKQSDPVPDQNLSESILQRQSRSGGRWAIPMIVTGVVIWCAIIVTGIARSESNDGWVKPAIMAGVFAAFLAIWGVLLRIRSRKPV